MSDIFYSLKKGVLLFVKFCIFINIFLILFGFIAIPLIAYLELHTAQNKLEELHDNPNRMDDYINKVITRHLKLSPYDKRIEIHKLSDKIVIEYFKSEKRQLFAFLPAEKPFLFLKFENFQTFTYSSIIELESGNYDSFDNPIDTIYIFGNNITDDISEYFNLSNIGIYENKLWFNYLIFLIALFFVLVFIHCFLASSIIGNRRRAFVKKSGELFFFILLILPVLTAFFMNYITLFEFEQHLNGEWFKNNKANEALISNIYNDISNSDIKSGDFSISPITDKGINIIKKLFDSNYDSNTSDNFKSNPMKGFFNTKKNGYFYFTYNPQYNIMVCYLKKNNSEFYSSYLLYITNNTSNEYKIMDFSIESLEWIEKDFSKKIDYYRSPTLVAGLIFLSLALIILIIRKLRKRNK